MADPVAADLGTKSRRGRYVAMDTEGPVWLVINGASGSNDNDALGQLTEDFTAAGCLPARIIDCQTDSLPELGEVERSGVALIAVFTGDGTANAVVGALEGWGGAVLVLPGGTANLLAKALHGDRSAAQIVSDLGSGKLEQHSRNCIRTSQGTALIEVLAGPGAAWSEVREGLREGTIGETAGKALEAVRQSATGPMVAVTRPALGRPEGYTGVRLAPVGATMTVDGYGADNAADYLKQGLALIRRDFREGPHDELGAHGEVVCRTADGGSMALMIDGERRDGAPEECFSLAPLRVNLLGTPRD